MIDQGLVITTPWIDGVYTSSGIATISVVRRRGAPPPLEVEKEVQKEKVGRGRGQVVRRGKGLGRSSSYFSSSPK